MTREGGRGTLLAMSESQLEKAIARIDAVNAEDPRVEKVGGEERPKELLYGQRMSEMLRGFAADPSEALQIAVRAQHIGRWQIPRSEFPRGRKGYHQWRTRLMEHHGQVAADIAREVGYDEATAERIERLVRKKGLRRDPEVQTLEDVACLVFLAHYFDEFSEGYPDDKVVDILRKTWGKMSEQGHGAALQLDLSDRARELVSRALSDEPAAASGPAATTEERQAEPAADDQGQAARHARVAITYCTQCGFLLRAAWTAQELLTTFRGELAEVALRPGEGGVFEVTIDGEELFSRRAEGRFPESKELKQRLRDRIAPDKDLGHSDR